MTAPQSLNLISFAVDLVAVTTDSLTVRHRRDGQNYTLTFEGLAIGADENGDGYTLTLPRAIASAQGLHDAA